jgi:hypothetical protein
MHPSVDGFVHISTRQTVQQQEKPQDKQSRRYDLFVYEIGLDGCSIGCNALLHCIRVSIKLEKKLLRRTKSSPDGIVFDVAK